MFAKRQNGEEDLERFFMFFFFFLAVLSISNVFFQKRKKTLKILPIFISLTVQKRRMKGEVEIILYQQQFITVFYHISPVDSYMYSNKMQI